MTDHQSTECPGFYRRMETEVCRPWLVAMSLLECRVWAPVPACLTQHTIRGPDYKNLLSSLLHLYGNRCSYSSSQVEGLYSFFCLVAFQQSGLPSTNSSTVTPAERRTRTELSILKCQHWVSPSAVSALIPCNQTRSWNAWSKCSYPPDLLLLSSLLSSLPHSSHPRQLVHKGIHFLVTIDAGGVKREFLFLQKRTCGGDWDSEGMGECVPDTVAAKAG